MFDDKIYIYNVVCHTSSHTSKPHGFYNEDTLFLLKSELPDNQL